MSQYARPRSALEIRRLQACLGRMRDQLKAQSRLMARMQRVVDQSGENVVQMIETMTTNYADVAYWIHYYNSDWFAETLFSVEIRRKIARTLVQQAAPFATRNELWERIAAGEMAPRREPRTERIPPMEQALRPFPPVR